MLFLQCNSALTSLNIRLFVSLCSAFSSNPFKVFLKTNKTPRKTFLKAGISRFRQAKKIQFPYIHNTLNGSWMQRSTSESWQCSVSGNVPLLSVRFLFSQQTLKQIMMGVSKNDIFIKYFISILDWNRTSYPMNFTASHLDTYMYIQRYSHLNKER